MPSAEDSTPAPRGPLGQLADGYVARAGAFCEERLQALLEGASPALLGFAEMAGSDATQSHFFAAVAQLDEARDEIGQGFRSTLDEGVRHFFSAERKESRPWLPRRSIVGIDEREINTVSNDDEALAIENLIIRTNARCFPELYALSQRLAAIRGGSKLRDDEIPAGPHHLAHSFRGALAAQDFDIRIKVVLYALFHHRVTWSAAELYQDLNTMLRDAGVLPKTRPVNLRPTRRPDLQLGANLKHLANPDDHEAVHEALVGDLLELAASQRISARSSAETPGDYRDPAQEGSRKPQEASTLEAFLKVLERTTKDSRIRPLRAGIRTQAGSITALTKPETVTPDSEALSVIGRMFAEMLDTPGLPATAKAMLAHLHTPYLQAAYADIGLVRTEKHVARQLLDECVEAASRWIDESDPRNGVLPILQETVDRIVDTIEHEPPPFQSLLENLRHRVQAFRQPQDLPERRCRDVQRERHLVREARRRARGEILSLLQANEVPRQARVFLETTWFELLTFVLLHRDEGPGSSAWREAVDTARSLIELFDPRVTGSALRTRIAELPRLRQRIANGAQRLGSYNRSTLAALDTLLANPHGVREQLRRHRVSASRPQKPRPRAPLPEFDGGPGSEAAEERETGELPETALQAMIDELRETKSGTWFELDSPLGDGSGRRIQLSWISPLTSTYLFVDEAGAKTEMRGLKDLAQAMLSGRARVVEAPPSAAAQDAGTAQEAAQENQHAEDPDATGRAGDQAARDTSEQR